MINLIDDPIKSTWIFSVIFLITLIITVRPKKDSEFFSLAVTKELKGFAILAVIFSHLGYFLVTDHRFLFPLSIMAGIGVDLFLFLSGFGLTVSSLKKELTIFKFYRHRLLKLFFPLWLTLIVFLSLDYLVLHQAYGWQFITKAFFGIFNSADIYRDFDSPLWYFTLILLYYLIFPLVFSKKRPWASALVIYLVFYALVKTNPIFFQGVMRLYEVHILAFSLGMIAAWLFYGRDPIYQAVLQRVTNRLQLLPCNLRFKRWLDKLAWRQKLENALDNMRPFFYYVTVFFLIAFIGYFAYNSGVGQGALKVQVVSVLTTLAVVSLFIIKRVKFNLFYWFGLYSYEIYLIHWPIVYRYDLFFKIFPGWLGIIINLFLFLILGWIMQKMLKIIWPKQF